MFSSSDSSSKAAGIASSDRAAELLAVESFIVSSLPMLSNPSGNALTSSMLAVTEYAIPVFDVTLFPMPPRKPPTDTPVASFSLTVIRDAAELKVKESNRIAVMVENLTAMGADVTETEDGMIIHGGKPLHGAVIDSKKDHRIAMTFAVAALGASGETEILDADCVNISYPGFYGDLERLCK